MLHFVYDIYENKLLCISEQYIYFSLVLIYILKMLDGSGQEFDGTRGKQNQ